MFKLIKSIFDVRSKWEHSRRVSWPKLLLAFLVVQTQNRGGRPGHSLTGDREIDSTSLAYCESKSAMATSLWKRGSGSC